MQTDLFDGVAALRETWTTRSATLRAGSGGARSLIWSYGGGVQSAAIAVLVLRGELPRPERIVMADTSREASATWAYLDGVVQPALGEVGLRVEVAPHALATKDLYDGQGRAMMPVYTRSGESGGVGQMRNFCSGEWKREVVRRYVRSLGYGPEGRSERGPVVNWLGISRDEVGRMGVDRRKWITMRWPLIFDRPTTRAECLDLVEDYGWPRPPKSSCWCCPYRGDAQWRELRDEWPEDWARAVSLEAESRQRDAGVYLHRSGVPLGEADLGAGGVGEVPCTSGQCWT